MFVNAHMCMCIGVYVCLCMCVCVCVVTLVCSLPQRLSVEKNTSDSDSLGVSHGETSRETRDNGEKLETLSSIPSFPHLLRRERESQS